MSETATKPSGVKGFPGGLKGFPELVDPWACTLELRWVPNPVRDAYSLPVTLQQKWVSTTGEIEWRDVPFDFYPR